jgi:hypothetical protein
MTTKIIVNSIQEAYSEFMSGFTKLLPSLNKDSIGQIDNISIFTAKIPETENMNEVYGWAEINKQDYGYAVYWKDTGEFTPKDLLQYFHKEMVESFYAVTFSEILFHSHKDKKDNHRYHINARGF